MSEALCRQLVDTARGMETAGLNKGTAGNLSVRTDEEGKHGFLITPTGMPYVTLAPEDIVFMRLDGAHEGLSGNRRQPSSEWRFHRDLYGARPEAGAIVHAHSPFATSLACLLANHGMLIFCRGLEQALALGVELEALCEQYWRACQLGQPELLDAAEMTIVLEKFADYGQQR